MRKTLSGKNMLKNFLKEHPYRLSQIYFRGSNLTVHPLRNIRDVFWEDGAPQRPLVLYLSMGFI